MVDNTEGTLRSLYNRLNPSTDLEKYVKELVERSIGSWTTHWYDSFQFYMAGVF